MTCLPTRCLLALLALAGPGLGCDEAAGPGADSLLDLASDRGLDTQGDLGVDDGLGDRGPDLPPAPDPLPDTTAQALAIAAAARFEEVDAPGLTWTVLLPPYAAHTQALGLADSAAATPAAPTDRFRVGSITKTFTAAAILQLVAESTLRLDDPLDTWVPGFDLGPDVTIERLLAHTSGIFNLTDDANFLGQSTEYAPPEAVVDWALSHGPVFAPGADYGYSNTGYFLLGLVLQAATDRPFVDVVRQRLLDPQALDDTFVEGSEPIAGGRVTGHLLGEPAEGFFDPSWSWAAGAMVSEGEDLCRWATALYLGEVLPPALRARMLTRGVVPGGSTPYGLGVQFATRGSLAVVGHTGSTMGFRGELFFHLDSGACVAVLTNDFFADQAPVAQALWQVLVPNL